MYIYLGTDTVTSERDIIGVFDLDACTVNKRTRDYLKKAEERKETMTVSSELPKSFVVASAREKQRVFITGVSAATIKRRSEDKDGGIL